MPLRKVFRFRRISELLVSIVTLCELLLCVALPGTVHADSKKFVTQIRGDAFDAAAVGATDSAKPTIAKIRLEEAGLVSEDNTPLNRAAAIWSDSSPAAIQPTVSNSSNPSGEDQQLTYGAPAYDAGFNQGTNDGSTASLWAANFYGGGGFYYYAGVPAGSGPSGQPLTGAESDRIDLGSGHPGDGGLSSADGPGRLRNGLMPRIKWPLRILTGQPAAVPEPSSLLLFGCGVLAVGLKRKLHSAK